MFRHTDRSTKYIIADVKGNHKPKFTLSFIFYSSKPHMPAYNLAYYTEGIDSFSKLLIVFEIFKQ